ncbi:MAG: PVC-type heme-binding CxxCH protein [Verrucomicrobiota bacterium]
MKKGYRLDLVASEPTIVSPVAIAFDEFNRLYVVEMIDYSERRDERLGRIRLVEDTNEDGKFDKATVFAEKLPWPTAVICSRGGIYVGASPDILWLKDTNGDGKADEREVVFTGFGANKDRLNVQALLNSFNWGLDNRIHGATAPNGGIITSPDNPQVKLDLNRRDFFFDPRTHEIWPENGGGQYGFSYDTRGRKYVCSNSHHLQAIMYDARYADRNPLYAPPPALVDIAVDGPAAEVYRASPEEAWRVIRTKWRVSGMVKGPIEGGGRASGYFTGATGVTIYRGNALPPEFLNNAFTGDAGGNLVHRKVIRQNGVELVAERPADEQKTEFIASTDNWFRPVQMANAPDGALYIIDMYREVIEHPWSLPENIKKHIDLNSGNDRGRLYRVVPQGFKQAKLPKLGKATTAELVTTLEHPNGWHRDTAARLLFERQDKTAVPALTKVISNSKSALGRMHALYALDGLGALDEARVVAALGDADAAVRQHAVRLAEKLAGNAMPSAALWGKLKSLTADPDANVRYQLAFSLGELKHADKVKTLAEIALRDGQDRWMQAAILSSLVNGAGEMFAVLSGDTRTRGSAGGREFLRQLVQLIGAANQAKEVAGVLAFVKQVEDAGFSFSLVRALGDGLQRARSSLARADTQGSLKDIFARAAKAAVDAKAQEATRVQAVQLLGLTSYAESGANLLSLLTLNQPQPVQLAAINTLGKFTDTQMGGALVERWNTFTPRVRSEALTELLKRPERITALLKAVEGGVIRPAELSSTQIRLLQNHRDAAIKQKALKLFAAGGTGQREQVVKTFLPALNLRGDAKKGKEIFTARCASCHRLSGEGFALGPDLVTVKTTGREKMLLNIINPNTEVAPQFLSYVIDTKDGESVMGLVVNETSASVTLRQAFGVENTIPRSNIAKMQSQGESLMPEGLEADLTPQDMANLLEFIETAEAK